MATRQRTLDVAPGIEQTAVTGTVAGAWAQLLDGTRARDQPDAFLRALRVALDTT